MKLVVHSSSVMRVRPAFVASLEAPTALREGEVRRLSDAVEWLEVRADLTGHVDPDWLRSRFRGRLIYSLRSVAEGGQYDDGLSKRHDLLVSASRGYDLVDLEAVTDLEPHVLSAIPEEKRLISWHGACLGGRELDDRFRGFSATAARFYKLAPQVLKPGDEVEPIAWLKSLRRSDTVAYGGGPLGTWSRVLSPHFGAPLVFGAAGAGSHADPSLMELIRDYDLRSTRPLHELYGIVGNPVSHSLSPRLHNAAYRALGYPAMFVPFQAHSFTTFWTRVVCADLLDNGLSLRGLTVASPHKEAALAASDQSSAMVRRSGATNLFLRRGMKWLADTTDASGVLLLVRRLGLQLRRKRAAVVGCGGSGRAIAAMLHRAGADVTLVNRGEERGRLAVRLLGLPFVPLSGFTVKGCSIVVNATPVGREDDRMPFSLEGLSEDAVVIDLAYGAQPTPLIVAARASRRTAISGRQVLRVQACCQFRMMTGRELPADVAHEVLGSDEIAVATSFDRRRAEVAE